MSPRARLRTWAILASMVTACGSGGGSGAEGPRDAEIVAAIDAFWAAVGVPAGKPYVGGYDYVTREDLKACEHLPEDQRWYAERGSILARGGDGIVAQAELHDAAISYFEENGYTVDRWRTSSPAAPVELALIAHNDAEQTAIEISISNLATATLAVRMGPCATPTLDGFTVPLYERVPD